MVIAVLAVWNEERLLPAAVDSCRAAGIQDVHVFDGAYENFGVGASTDATLTAAAAHGAQVHAHGTWQHQQEKRTACFQEAGASTGDHILILDADERLHGTVPVLEPGQSYHVLLKNVAENDLPGIRKVFPRGDYSAELTPRLRLFAWSPALECRWAGSYWNEHGRIVPYLGQGGEPALPVAAGFWIAHHNHEHDQERIEQKRKFYLLEQAQTRETCI